MLTHSTIRIGDTAKFPLGRLGDVEVYRHRWAVWGFTRDGAVIARRLADGCEKTISVTWWERYAIDARPAPRRGAEDAASATRAARLAALRARRVQDARHQTDPTQPGYYVSAIRGPQAVALLGPFADHYSALQLVETARRLARPYDPYHERRIEAALPAGWALLTQGDPRGYCLQVIPPSYAERNAGRDRFNLESIGVPSGPSRLRW